ncbi:peptidoglycan-binding protein [Streptomyces sp. NBC_00316]|uniref:peptidoglycan-binding protein n=1 Tax=Streptomyces sp. NBC_00316 TaxID=2975710 RepID=UPI002E2C68ED|nr:peptidoglycan-binding protein [Streptomyces sp. NBC_00316]
MKDAGRERAAGDDGADDRAGGRRTGRRGRGPLLIAAGFLLVAVVSTVGALGLGGGGTDDGAAPGRSSHVVPVTRETLTEQTEVDGRLGHGPEVPFQIKAEGTLTWLPTTGSTVRRGGKVLRVDDRPVILLYGSLPMYRDLGVTEAEPQDAATGSGGDGPDGGTGTAKRGDADGGSASGSSAGGGSANADGAGAVRAAGAPRQPAPLHGMDVKQFESNLSALGYSGFTVDESYTVLTADAVKRWQKDLDLPQTGEVDAGDIVYAPGPVRIAGTDALVGADASGNPLTYTSTSRMVTVNVPATDTNWAQRGSEVAVDLPDGRSVKGEIARVGKDASSSGASGGGDTAGKSGEDGGDSADGTAATVSVVITFADQDSLGRLESGPVTVRHVVKQRKGVLTVPVAALVALAEGGYGLELAAQDGGGGGADSGAGRFVPARTGLYAGGKVEVSGPRVHEGMKVRIPE